jgi:hypothetical protein
VSDWLFQIPKGPAMPNVMKVLKEEIARISRKEAKAGVTPIRLI